MRLRPLPCCALHALYFARAFVRGPVVLSELLPAAQIRTPLLSRDKSALLRELVALALPSADVETRDGVLSAVLARETEVSTAMGGGLAVPHGRTDLVPEVRVAAGLVRDVADYAAPDDAPVEVAFLVLTPPHEASRHVRLLARIARLLHTPSSRSALLGARTAEEFRQVVLASEAA